MPLSARQALERNGVDWIFQGSFNNLVFFSVSHELLAVPDLLMAKHGVYLSSTTLQTSLNQYQSLSFHFSLTRFPSVTSHLRCTTSYIFSFTPSFPGRSSANLFNSSSNRIPTPEEWERVTTEPISSSDGNAYFTGFRLVPEVNSAGMVSSGANVR
jgi:hypothetical protein